MYTRSAEKSLLKIRKEVSRSLENVLSFLNLPTDYYMELFLIFLLEMSVLVWMPVCLLIMPYLIVWSDEISNEGKTIGGIVRSCTITNRAPLDEKSMT